jgi:hypothetical protein
VSPSACPDCGAPVAGGRAGCQKLFDEVLAREFGDFRYARLHRLTVDAYSLQHPAEYMRSGKSYAAHLTGMCAAMELDDARSANETVQRWLNGPTAIERPSEPPASQRGALTIAHLHAAADADQHLARVREWARSTWDAWRDYHAIARQWIDRAGAGTARK